MNGPWTSDSADCAKCRGGRETLSPVFPPSRGQRRVSRDTASWIQDEAGLLVAFVGRKNHIAFWRRSGAPPVARDHGDSDAQQAQHTTSSSSGWEYAMYNRGVTRSVAGAPDGSGSQWGRCV